MGLLDRMKERREAAERERAEGARLEAAATAHRTVSQALDRWTEQRQELADMLELAETYEGEMGPEVPIMLKKGERAFMVAGGAALIEPRRPPGHFEGASHGVSFRVAKGVSYRVGQSRGQFVQEAERPTPIDQGSITVTNQRVVFQGASVVREWHFAKLVGVSHDPNLPWTALQVSNRQKVSGFLYDDEHAQLVRFKLALGLAHFNGEVEELADRLRREIAAHAAARPQPPGPPALPG